MIGKLVRSVKYVAGDLLEMEPCDLALRLTLVYFVFKPIGEDWYLTFPAMSLSAWGLISPRAMRSPWLWLALTVVNFLCLSLAADNHLYLRGYWALAIVCSLLSSDPDEAIATHARWLLGLVFSFAVLWKLVLAADYRNGDFFLGTLLLDQRFRPAAVFLGGLSPEQWAYNVRVFQELRAGTLPANTCALQVPDQVIYFSQASTWMLAAVEIGIAMSLIGRRFVPRYLLHWLMIPFLCVTYGLAPVIGFGWLLAILSLVQCDRSEWVGRLAYLVSLVAIFAHGIVPWAATLNGLSR